jgi:hypothetical protein
LNVGGKARNRTEPSFEGLLRYLGRVPGIEGAIGRGSENRGWWVKFGIDVFDPLAWRVVQELGHVLNYISLDERLPTSFFPVSPPPALNGGVKFLSWVIECHTLGFSPDDCASWLEESLPIPVENRSEWELED